MRRHLSKAAIFSWLVSTPEQKLRFELVDALYATPKSIFVASIAALFVVATTLRLSGDHTYAWIFVGFLAVGVGRTVSILLTGCRAHDPDDTAATTMWERRALVGAWAFACLVGFTGAYTVPVHPNSDVELLVNSCVMGYIAGISSRNASRPIISIGQVSLTAFPFLIALGRALRSGAHRARRLHRRSPSQHHRHLPGGVREHHFPPHRLQQDRIDRAP